MMKTGCTGTERPKNGTGGLRRVVLALAVLLLTCVLMAGAVSADDGAATVSFNSYSQSYSTLAEAFAAAVDISIGNSSAEVNILLNKDFSGAGIGIFNANTPQKSKIVLDLGTHTYTCIGPAVGSEGTESQAFHLEKGHDVTIKNGVVVSSSDDVKMLIQNYCNLTLENVTLDGTNLPGSYPYTLSNNCGNTVLKGNTKIIAADDGVAFDVCYAPTKGYSEGVSVTIASDTVVISGPVEYGIWGTSDQYRAEKAIFNVPYGYDVDLTVSKPEESHGYYYWKATSDNQMVFTLKENSPIKVLQDNAVVSADGSTVTLLRDTTLDEPILIETPITFDGNGKKISGESDTGYFLMVAVPLKGNETESVTLQNLNLSIDSIGSSANLGGITVRANEDNDASVPVTLKGSIVDMSEAGMTSTSMNPAVYFVNAPNSQITNNEITAGAASSSSTRCVVVDGGSDVTVSDNILTLGSVSDTAVAVGVEIKGNDVDKVTVSGNTLNPGTNPGDTPRAVKITAKDKGTDSQKTFTVSKNNIQFGGKGTTVEVLLSTYMITDPANAQVNLDVEENTGSTAYVVMLNKENANGNQILLDSAITLTGNIYNPALTSPEEVAVVGGFTDDGSEQPNTDGVTHVNPAPQPVYSSGGNMNNAYRVLFNDGATTLSVQTDLSSGDKLTKPETPVKDGYTFAGWYKDSACTQAWDFETGISGDMTLYAKWTAAGSSGETEATATPTKTQTAVTTPQPTKTQTAAATTSAPEATTAAGVSPTLTQAPAPVAGALFGLLAAGVLLRRRFQ